MIFWTFRVTLKEEKIAKEKKCEIKECEWVAQKFMRGGIKECESTNCFRKCGIKDCDPSIFREMRNKNCEVLSKNWKNLHLAMLILACTNYIS